MATAKERARQYKSGEISKEQYIAGVKSAVSGIKAKQDAISNRKQIGRAHV